jgi:hypothetical protein
LTTPHRRAPRGGRLPGARALLTAPPLRLAAAGLQLAGCAAAARALGASSRAKEQAADLLARAVSHCSVPCYFAGCAERRRPCSLTTHHATATIFLITPTSSVTPSYQILPVCLRPRGAIPPISARVGGLSADTASPDRPFVAGLGATSSVLACKIQVPSSSLVQSPPAMKTQCPGKGWLTFEAESRLTFVLFPPPWVQVLDLLIHALNHCPMHGFPSLLLLVLH